VEQDSVEAAKAEEIKQAEAETDNTMWYIIGAVALVLIAAIVAIIMKKRK